jgi:hypothetical protein
VSQHQIAVVIGSLRRDSFNRKLATAVVKLAPPEFSFKQVQIGDLPLYNQDDDARQPDAVKRLKGEITASHGPKQSYPSGFRRMRPSRKLFRTKGVFLCGSCNS